MYISIVAFNKPFLVLLLGFLPFFPCVFGRPAALLLADEASFRLRQLSVGGLTVEGGWCREESLGTTRRGKGFLYMVSSVGEQDTGIVTRLFVRRNR